MPKNQLFYIEVTDTFGGEANYSWVARHVISANTRRGAVQKFSRLSGINWKCVAKYSDMERYDSASGASCYFIEDYDDERHGERRLETDQRP